MDVLTLHDLAVSSRPAGVECIHCIHRAVFVAKDLRAKQGDRRTLAEAGVRCGKCGSRQFSVVQLASPGKVHAFLRNL
jgi:Zn finger protein HypA/HybF involved in hydrogenase expression